MKGPAGTREPGHRDAHGLQGRGLGESRHEGFSPRGWACVAMAWGRLAMVIVCTAGFIGAPPLHFGYAQCVALHLNEGRKSHKRKSTKKSAYLFTWFFILHVYLGSISMS